MTQEELITDYLLRHKNEVELPRAEAKQHLLQELARARSEEDTVAASSAGQKPRSGLARLAGQLIAGGQRLTDGTPGRPNAGDWSGRA